MLKSLVLLAVIIVCLAFAAEASREKVRVFDSVEKIGLGTLTGPESMVWDNQGNLYTGIADGSIKRVDATTGAITTYAYSVPHLSEEDRALCGTAVTFEILCGRPLGLFFDRAENLWVADAYKGILKIPRDNTTNVQTIVNNYNGISFKMTNALYLTNDESTLYFTDTTRTYPRYMFVNIVVANAPDGRLFKLNLRTNKLSVAIDDLKFANGIAVGNNEEFLLVNECSARRIRKYYLKGKKEGRNEVLVEDIGGYNDNIRPDGLGNFYVGLFSFTSEELSAILDYPKLQALTLQFIPQTATLGLIQPSGLIKKIDSRGRVLEVIKSANSSVLANVAEADIHDGYLYIGSVLNNYLGKVKLSDLKNVRE